MRVRALFLFLLFCLLSAGFCGKSSDSEKIIVLQGVEGLSVFDLLTADHEVDFSMSEMGVFVSAIDGIKNRGGHSWIFYVNDRPGQKACDRVIAKEGDVIEWRYE